MFILLSANTLRNPSFVIFTLYDTIMGFNDLDKDHSEPLQNILGNGENAGYQPFLLFQQYFLPYGTQK